MQRSARAVAGLIHLTIAVVLAGCATTAKPPAEAKRLPQFPREFRGAWVTTLGNIDWPSKPGLGVDELKKEVNLILERAQDLNLNAILLQVRASGDTIYPSKTGEPWARSLTGARGRAMQGFDPLQYWIDESHRRGIELHAWFNPFRAGYDNDPPDEGTRSRTVIHKYGKLFWFDPGDLRTQKQILRAADDVVRRYAVDGVCADYNSYYPTTRPATQPASQPTPIPSPPAPYPNPFPDDRSYTAYVEQGGKLARDDWRRDNIDRFMKALGETIKRRRKSVQFGISPYGIARVGQPSFATGPDLYDPYETVYADSAKWLRSGWCDYFVPSLYWKTGATNAHYLGLLKWWVDPKRNPKSRHIYGGLFTSQVKYTPQSWSPDEILGQVMITREVPGTAGNTHFSMHVMTRNPRGFADELRKGPYAEPALPPRSAWLAQGKPERPKNVKVRQATASEVADAARRTPIPAKREKGVESRMFAPIGPDKDRPPGAAYVTWDRPDDKAGIWRWAVYSLHGERWKMRIVGIAPGDTPKAVIPDSASDGPATVVQVAAVDAAGTESAREEIRLGKP